MSLGHTSHSQLRRLERELETVHRARLTVTGELGLLATQRRMITTGEAARRTS